MARPPRTTKTTIQLELRKQGKCGAWRKPHGPRMRNGVEIAPAEDPEGGPYFCTLRAGHGTDHVGYGECRYHGGNTPAVKRSAEIERATEVVATMGLPRDIPPTQALLEEVQRSAGVVAYLQGIVSELEQSELKQYTESDGKMWERPSVWYEMYHKERQHLVRAAAEAIKCGVAERSIKLAEQQGALMAEAIRGILTDLGVIDVPEVPAVVRKHLLAIAGGQA